MREPAKTFEDVVFWRKAQAGRRQDSGAGILNSESLRSYEPSTPRGRTDAALPARAAPGVMPPGGGGRRDAHDQRRQRQTAQRMFEAGETGRLGLATAELEVFTTELLRLDAVVKAQQALGALEDAVQQPLGSPAASALISEKNPRTENTQSTK